MPYGNLQSKDSNVKRKIYSIIASKQKGDVMSVLDLEIFEEKWKTVLLTTQKYLVCLPLVESDKMIEKTKFKIEFNSKKEDPFGF